MTGDAGTDDRTTVVPSLDAIHPASEDVAAFAADVPVAGADVAGAIAWAVRCGPLLPLPASGGTARRWEMLGAAAAVDVAAARVLEPHVDALAILAEAREDGYPIDDELPAIGADAHSSWGVYAAEGPGVRLTATRGADGAWRLDGTKPWCSLAGRLSHGLVTAWTDDTTRALFAVSLHADGVSAHDGPWVSRGLPSIISALVAFDSVPAVPVGDAGWYLHRAGFAWGGIGVAAVWWGGALPLVARLGARAARPDADQIARLDAGRAMLAAWTMRAVLAEAARLVDAGHPSPSSLAATVRAVIHGDARRIRDLAVQALGPGPLTADEPYAARIADLETYLGQHHGDRDVARLVGRPA